MKPRTEQRRGRQEDPYSAFVKRWIQEDGRDVPEEFFKLNTMNIVSVTKA